MAFTGIKVAIGTKSKWHLPNRQLSVPMGSGTVLRFTTEVTDVFSVWIMHIHQSPEAKGIKAGSLNKTTYIRIAKIKERPIALQMQSSY